MSLYHWGVAVTQELITNDRLNAQGYNLFKGVAGYEDSIRLANNVAGTFVLRPNSDPVAGTELLQVSNAAGTRLAALTSDGGIIINGTASIGTLAITATSQANQIITGTASINQLNVSGAATLGSTLSVVSTLEVAGTSGSVIGGSGAQLAPVASILEIQGTVQSKASLTLFGSDTVAAGRGPGITFAGWLNGTSNAGTLGFLEIVKETSTVNEQSGQFRLYVETGGLNTERLRVYSTGGMEFGTVSGTDPGTGIVKLAALQVTGAATMGSTLNLLDQVTVQTSGVPIPLVLKNTSSTGNSFVQVQNNLGTSALGSLGTYGSGTSSIVFGVSSANYTIVSAGGASSNGLLLGTSIATPLIFGTNNTEVGRVYSGGGWSIGSTASDPGAAALAVTGNLIRGSDSGNALRFRRITVADNGTSILPYTGGSGAGTKGLVVVIAEEDAATAIYVINGNAGTVAEIADPGSKFTVTSGNAGTTNIYWDGSAYTIQNKTGGSRNYDVWFFITN